MIEQNNENQLHDVQRPIVEELEQAAVQTIETLFVNEFTDGVIDPEQPFLGPLRDGGTIIATTAPGCWGPMLTPSIKGAQEVTKPVYVDGAEVGDAVVIEIKDIQVTSLATASGIEEPIVDRYISDPLLKVKCPGCGKLHPQTLLEGMGTEAIRCATCHTSTAPLKVRNGYTMAFHNSSTVAVTVGKEATRKIAGASERYMRLPENSLQHAATVLAPSDVTAVATRMRPAIGEIGTVPSKKMPASSNAGDTGRALIGAYHEMQLTEEQLWHCTDGHLHLPQLRAGATIICPVRVKGAGIYVGDIHAMQGAGQVAGHAPSVAGIVQLKVNVIKKLQLEGPIILPNAEDLPYLAQPLSRQERKQARDVAADYQMKQLEESFPISVVGTAATINEAIDCALQRMSNITNIALDEVKNRVTICGGIEIGRLPGLVTATAQFPKTVLKNAKIFKAVKNQYDN